MLIYIHGFNSSAQSFKARLLRERMVALGRGAEFRCPELDHRPSRAIEQLEEVIAHADVPVCLIGSSLGGYYATYLAEKHAVRAALVNPAVRPYDLLAAYIGPQRNLYTGAEYEFTAQHLAELRALDVPVTPRRYLLLVATGDEVLDYRMATSKYQGCEQIVVRGGDHGFAGFASHIDVVLDFFRRDIIRP
ncbi:MAG TPA: YqiA/YcfP family alpha/beta fold hydrolase [Burkholderiales bacterium]|nr:YqiA/YcfP family alpha/beta fold hydrolase [Burkholderiales bacterium]